MSPLGVSGKRFDSPAFAANPPKFPACYLHPLVITIVSTDNPECQPKKTNFESGKRKNHPGPDNSRKTSEQSCSTGDDQKTVKTFCRRQRPVGPHLKKKTCVINGFNRPWFQIRHPGSRIKQQTIRQPSILSQRDSLWQENHFAMTEFENRTICRTTSIIQWGLLSTTALGPIQQCRPAILLYQRRQRMQRSRIALPPMHLDPAICNVDCKTVATHYPDDTQPTCHIAGNAQISTS